MTTWQQLSLDLPEELTTPISDFLEDHGALSVTCTDAGHHPVFGEHLNESPLWPKTRLTALFSSDMDLHTLLNTIPSAWHSWFSTATISILEEQDWVRETQRHFPPQEIAPQAWVLPSWVDPSEYAGTIVRIDPGLAFGTGTHATTRLCLQWLGQHPPQNLEVIDYGCGSGILALTALALGAHHVTAIDHDPQAIEATQQNATLNSFVTKQNLAVGQAVNFPELNPAPLVIANILSSVLLELHHPLTKLTEADGTLLLSGILTTEHQRILDLYMSHYTLMEMHTDEEWCLLVLKRNLSKL